MDDKITFRAEIEFYGSPDELASVIEGVRRMPVRVIVDKWPHPIPFPGLWPFPILKVLSPDVLAKYTKGRPVFPEKILDDIRGGIREPHLHFKDQVALLDRETFSKVMGSVAEQIVQEIAMDGDYFETIGALRELSEMEGRF
jgi:hypothetical protein